MNIVFGTITSMLLIVFSDKTTMRRIWKQLKQGYKSKKQLKREGVDVDLINRLQEEYEKDIL